MDIILTFLFLVGSFFLGTSSFIRCCRSFFLAYLGVGTCALSEIFNLGFIGGMAGGAFLGFGQAVIHLLQLVLFNAIIRYPFAQKSIQLTVAGCILVVQLLWQFMMNAGQLPMDVQFFIGFEVILALFMTFFLFVAFPPRQYFFWSMVT